MCGTPFTCCSMGAAMDCSMVPASAPGKLVDTTMVGGVISGKRAIGSPASDTPPAIVMTMAKTVEKIG